MSAFLQLLVFKFPSQKIHREYKLYKFETNKQTKSLKNLPTPNSV